METRSLIRRRSLLGISVVIFVMATANGSPLVAQTSSNNKQGGAVPSAAEAGIPQDHYDPDDTKTYQDVLAEDRPVSIRGQLFTVHFYRAKGDGPSIPAIYACGDGGWRGLAPRTAQQLAHVGFVVAGIDSKVYLRQLSSVRNPLNIAQLASDYAEIAKALRDYAKLDSAKPVYIYGWSLGAGFAIAVGSDIATRANWAGIISIGLPRQNQLVSGVGGNHANLNVENNERFGFRSQDVMAAISPLPLVMIQSTSDTASPPKVGNALFASARDPKQYVLITASNHRFSGARDQFYAALTNAVSWMQAVTKPVNSAQATKPQ